MALYLGPFLFIVLSGTRACAYVLNGNYQCSSRANLDDELAARAHGHGLGEHGGDVRNVRGLVEVVESI